ncbi:hypothetical protein ACFE04_018804 [Oxalis oulophora]
MMKGNSDQTEKKTRINEDMSAMLHMDYTAIVGLMTGQRQATNRNPQVLGDRDFIRYKIFLILIELHSQRSHRQPNNIAKMDCVDIANFCEEQLFKMALTRVKFFEMSFPNLKSSYEYLNMHTLEGRVKDVFTSGTFGRLFKKRQVDEGPSPQPINISRRRITP